MREIKFRAYDKCRNEYLSGGNIFISVETGSRPIDSKFYLDIIKYPNLYKDRFIVEQYIEMKDCDMKEIYENDIIRNAKGYDFVVKFINGCFTPYHEQGFIFDDAENCYVVGNIHDNPELI